MLNIDFKVSGNFVSVPLCLTDTIDSLLARIQTLKPFKKYPSKQLEVKLVSSLKHIVQSGNLQDHIIQKINLILSSKLRTELQINESHKTLNQTPLNILQDTTINISNYNPRQQHKIHNCKFVSSNYLTGFQDDLQNRLRRKYQKGSQKQVQTCSYFETNYQNKRRNHKQDQQINEKLRMIQNDYQIKKNTYFNEKFSQNQQAISQFKMLKKNPYTASSGHIHKSDYRTNNYLQNRHKGQFGQRKCSINLNGSKLKTDIQYTKSIQKLAPFRSDQQPNTHHSFLHKSVGKIARPKKYSYL